MQAVATPDRALELKITNRAEAEHFARRGARVASLLAGAVAARDTAVTRAGETNKRRISLLSAERARIDVGLASWAQENRVEFGDKQSLELQGALLEFHVGPRYVDLVKDAKVKKDESALWKKALSLVVHKGKVLLAWRPWIRIKFEFDKRKILSDSGGQKPKLTSDKLKTVGLKISQDESFSIAYRVTAPTRNLVLMESHCTSSKL